MKKQQGKKQQSSSSTLAGTKSVSVTCVSLPSAASPILAPVPSTSTAGQVGDGKTLHEAVLASGQKKADILLQNRNASQIISKGSPVSSACTQILEDQRGDVITRRIVASSSLDSKDALCAGKGTTSVLQSCNSGTRNALKKLITVPTKYGPAKVVRTVSSSGVKSRKHIIVSPPGKVVSPGVSGQKVSVKQQHPVQSLGASKNTNSSRKGKIVSKNAEIVAAREVLENYIEDCKSKIAEVEATKKRKSVINKPVKLEREVSSTSFKPGFCNDERDEKRVELRSTDSMKECVATCVNPLKSSKEELHIKAETPAHTVKDTHKAPYHKTALAKQISVEKKAICAENQLNDFTRLLPSRSEPGEEQAKCSHSSPSKSLAKAKIEEELKATAEKLQATRKRMGIMLKEPPQNSDQRVSDERRIRLQQLTSKLTKGSSVVQPESTPTSAHHAKNRPFPNRRSLKWTPEKTPQRESSENGLLISSWPNVRSLVLDLTPVSTRGKRPSLSHRRSQVYSIVRSNSTPVAEKSVTPVQRQCPAAHFKSFISRYKVQRVNRESEMAASVLRKTVVQSRFKLMKFNAKDQPHSPTGISGMSTPLSANQKAAQIIKTKYKMRKVFVPSPPNSADVQTNRHKFYSPKSHATNSVMNFPSVQSLNGNKPARFFYGNSFFQVPHAFPSDRRGRGFPGQRMMMNSPGCFQTGFWKGGFGVSNSVAGGWGVPYRRSPRLQSKMQRAIAMKVWKQQWQWGGMMYNQTAPAMQMRRWQQWRNTSYSLRKQMDSHQPTSSQKKRKALSRGERLVMINGTVYKCSSTTLTKASSADAAAAEKSATAAGGKGARIQTVMVRGVRFQVNARGTHLQREVNSAKKGKTDAGGHSRVQSPRVLGNVFDTQTRYAINQVKQRSILLAAAKYRKKAEKERKKNCLYFSRFGKCSRGEHCPFVHDPAKVAVCTRFLRGTCQVENCPFSHKVSKEKMPVCSFFLKGVCTRESCPYLHVKVSQGAQVCQDFVSGFCPLADKCQKLHTLTCPHFARTGSCPDGKKCRLQHRRPREVGKPRPRPPSPAAIHTPTDSTKDRKRLQSDDRQESQDKGENGKAPTAKRFRPDSSKQSKQQTQHCIPQQKTVRENDTVTTDAESVKSAGGVETAQRSEVDGEQGQGPILSQPTLPKLPAFISLADYSFEDTSPVPKAKVLRSQKSASQKKGQGLQIKPQL
ncbi:hypothetical protein ACOMHN_002295 [Nucella lapillus]